ncbi:MAG TPA: PAS domain S-box protein [Anaerolineales bacterium]|nr:PAS domain S-box protein [Anaerolineales bacterium]
MEDSEDDTQLILREIRRGGYDLQWERVDSRTAMQAALAHGSWDIVISDHNLPQFNSLSALETLHESGHDLPFIIASRSIGEETAADILKAGAHDFVIKDKMARLVPAIQRELKEAETRRARRRADELLRESEERYRSLYENATIGLYRTTPGGRILAANPALVKMLGYGSLEELVERDLTREGYEPAYPRQDFQERIEREGEIRGLESAWKQKDGSTIYVRESSRLVRDGRGQPLYYEGTVEDISARKRAEDALRKSEERYRTIFNESIEGIFQSTPEGQFLIVNPALAHMWGYDSPEELVSSTRHTAGQIYADGRDRERFSRLMAENDQVYAFEYEARRKDGKTMWVSQNVHATRDRSGTLLYYEGTVEDITQRKLAEQAVRQHLVELETLYESGLGLSQLLSVKEIAQRLIEQMSTRLNWHHITVRLYHPEDDTLELLAFHVPGTGSPAELQAAEQRFKSLIAKIGDGLSGWAVQHSQAVRLGDLPHDPRYIEIEPGLQSGLYVPLKVGDRVVGVISVESEQGDAFSESDERLTATLANQAAIALENARLHEETVHQLKQLQALHTIDRTIAGSFDQGMMLDVLLTQTLSQLGADAAVIFLIQPHQRGTLQYIAGQGFRTQLVQLASAKLGNSIAAEAVLKRVMTQIREPEAGEGDPLFSKLWAEEGFKCMETLPLISKGEVKGVMSVFHRKDFTPEPEWTSFLETLAGQAAIAIDVTQMFDNLQRANMELAVAYEATIEGWSQAMDLRDKETEGHTQRVTGMTIQIAKAMNLGEENILKMRRGALLHDIGKLGVPDHILLKADKLTDEEWLVMKKHPEFAHDMLHAIAYLRGSMDIPYCHHEKWDGTGYPQGLQGEQIPLPARIFAIVDVWDALTSDRPYRKAWSKGDAMQYIREQSGKHFDPQVVEIFLKEFGSQ